MTMRSIGGLVVLNASVLVVGVSLLLGLRPFRSWSQVALLSGLAYFLGLAALTTMLTIEITVGVPFGRGALLATGGAMVAAGMSVRAARRFEWPRLGVLARRRVRPSFFAVIGFGGIALWFAVAFRATRLEPLWPYDAYWVWTIRAKALYYFGGLGSVDFVRGGDHGLMPYPPGLSLLHAAEFEAMGSVDTVTLHLQHWFLALAFVAGVIGVLAPRTHRAILLPFVLLMLVMPGFTERMNVAMADLLLAYFACLGALVLYLWVEDRSQWLIAAAALLLGGAVLVKREGLLVVLCVFLASAGASWPARRWAWPRIAVAATAAVLFASSWRVWLIVNDFNDAPSGGYLAFLRDHQRALPSLELVLRAFVGELSTGVGLISLAALVLAFAVGARRLPIFVLVFVTSSLATSAFVIWSEQSLELTEDPRLNPVDRMVLVPIIVLAPLTPLMLEEAWRMPGLPWLQSSANHDHPVGHASVTRVPVE